MATANTSPSGNPSITASTAAVCAATTNAAQSTTEVAAKRPRCISVSNAGHGNYAVSGTGRILVSRWNNAIAARLMGLARWDEDSLTESERHVIGGNPPIFIGLIYCFRPYGELLDSLRVSLLAQKATKEKALPTSGSGRARLPTLRRRCEGRQDGTL